MSESGDLAAAFLRRARQEADRYGPDDWVFVRELLQNARDAGAHRVELSADVIAGNARILCRDDGHGMTLEHARRYLFRLYASSKEGDPAQAGRFGVGFWSVLRFEPRAVTIRSRTTAGPGWGLTLRLDAQEVVTDEAPPGPGTTIVLERPAREPADELRRRLRDAARQNGRFLRNAAGTAVVVLVDGEPVSEPFVLPAPSVSFRGRGLRGVVGLGPAARVELFSRGLRVRSAASLEDLLAAGGSSAHSRVDFPELPGGLAPQAIIDGDGLEPLLSRSDVRDDRALRRLVERARKELVHLVARQLHRYRPEPTWRRLFEGARAVTYALAVRPRAALAVLSVLAVAAGVFVVSGVERATRQVPPARGGEPAPPWPGTSRPASHDRIYRDLARRYHGPEVDPLSEADAERPAIDLDYRPAHLHPRFAALLFADFARDGSPRPARAPPMPTRLPARACREDCLTVTLAVAGEGEPVRIPVPTGHAVIEGSVRLDGQPVSLATAADGLPALAAGARFNGQLSYRTAPHAETTAARPAAVIALPPALTAIARAARQKPRTRAVAELVKHVESRIAYDRSLAVIRKHQQARARGEGFLTRTLAIGAGDCDVQNTVLALLLNSAGIPARLAAGYLGIDGEVWSWPHAWVEYQDERGRWQIADASRPLVLPAPARLPANARAPAAPDPAVTVAATPRPASPAPPRRWPAPLALLAVALGAGALLALIRTRPQRHLRLDDSGDASRLLQGALQQPRAFRALGAVFRRRLIPLVRGDALALERALALAARGRLFASLSRGKLAMTAARSGAVVIDTGTRAGQVVSAALATIDLDGWNDLLASAHTGPLVEAVNGMLRRAGEPWFLLAGNVPAGVAALDLAAIGARVNDRHGNRVVLIDAHSEPYRRARALFERQPRVAAFDLLDDVLARLDLEAQRRGHLLRLAAEQALPALPEGGAA